MDQLKFSSTFFCSVATKLRIRDSATQSFLMFCLVLEEQCAISPVGAYKVSEIRIGRMGKYSENYYFYLFYIFVKVKFSPSFQ